MSSTNDAAITTDDVKVELLIPGWPNEDDKDRIIVGEGPIYDARTDELFFVDILGCAVHGFNCTTHAHRVIPVGRHVSTIVLSRRDGFLWIALPDGIYHLDTTTGKVHDEGLYIEKDMKLGLNRLNEGKCDYKGRLWVGSMTYDESILNNAALYCLIHDEQKQSIIINKALSPISLSNGICWTPDSRTMWYIDSMNHGSVDEMTLNEDGTIIQRKTAFTIDLPILDGMTRDTQGNLYIAHWNGGCVTVWDPTTCKRLRTITIPGVSRVSSCIFGGHDMTDLYITTASRDAKREEEPNAGSLYVVRGLAKGIPEVPFATTVGTPKQ